GLPTPEREAREAPERETRVPGPLHNVVARAHQRRAAERENDAERVCRPEAAEGEPRNVEVQRGPCQLRRDEHAIRHRDDAPHRRGEKEETDDVVVVGLGLRHSSALRFTVAILAPGGGTLLDLDQTRYFVFREG